MAHPATQTRNKVQFCSVVSEESGESPFGSAWHATRYILVEIPLPWKYDLLESPKVPAGLHDMVHQLYDAGIYPALIGFAPDEAWSVEGHTRVIEYTVPEAPFQQYEQREYLFPTEQLAGLIGPFLQNEHGSSLDSWLVAPALGQRDILVCTHGAIDACCATFGYPVYKLLRMMADNPEHSLRVWRCTHFGGHRFAATMLEMPGGRYWGHLEAKDLGPIVRRAAPNEVIRARYRGWAALPYGSAQVAECELFARAGWAWLDTSITPGVAPPFDWEAPIAEPQAMSFRVQHEAHDVEGDVEVRVTPAGFIPTKHSSGADIAWDDAQQFVSTITATTGNAGLLVGPADTDAMPH